ncbi:MAG: hypothetical protein AAGM33_12500 [Pseudomonadota bacterium]
MPDTGLPFAPIARPEDMFDDPHLNAGGGLEPVTLDNGEETKLPALPIEIDGARPSSTVRLSSIGQHTEERLAGLGYSPEEIVRLREKGAIE